MIELRPIQERAIDRVREAMGEHRRIVLCSPTGFGKTVVGAEVARRAVDRGKRVLWLTHRVELLEQSAGHLRARGVPTGIIAAGYEPEEAPCQVASLDTLISRGIYPPADVVVFDECHHAQAETWGALLAHYANARVLGMTATPERGDGRGLDGSFDALVVGSTVRELTELGILVPLRVVRPEERLRSGRIAQPVVEAYRAHAPGSRAIAFFPTVALAESYAEEFRAVGIPAACVHGNTASAERAEALRGLRDGTVRVVTNVNVLTEGFDCPAVSTIILARGIGTTGGFDQILGRGVRCSPGKVDALLIDLTGVSHIHGMPIDGRVYSLSGVGISSGAKAEDSFCKVCGALRVPGQVCADCGYEPEPIALTVANVPLFDYRTQLAGDAPEVRYQRLVRWIRAAMTKGHRLGAAKGRYRAVYGVWPRDFERALREAGG